MNRREFCFSLGAAVMGGGVVCSAKCETQATSVSAEPVIPVSFRAKKVYPEQWRDVLDFDSVSKQTKMLPNSLRELVGNDTSLVVASPAGMSSEFLKLLQKESLRAGLELYLPADFPGKVTYYGMATDCICPLQVTQHGIEFSKLDNAPCDGFLFSLSRTPDGLYTKSRGMILCDASRGTWQTFICQTSMRHGEEPQGDRNLANLQTAQWLDFAKKRLYRL